jgi:hypothetical protein
MDRPIRLCRGLNMKELYKALSDFQQEVPNIYKNATGYGYKFADLGEINEIIKPLLKKHNLGYVQPIEGDTIKTIVFHTESGESIEGSANIPQGVQLKGMNDFQVLGSAITYLRRYSLSSMLGLVTDEDADASGEQTSKPAVKPKTTYTTSKTNQATDFQRSTMANLLRQRGIEGAEAILEFLQDEHGVVVKDGIAQLTEIDAQLIIESLDTKGQ